jgi:hypothetical protein
MTDGREFKKKGSGFPIDNGNRCIGLYCQYRYRKPPQAKVKDACLEGENMFVNLFRKLAPAGSMLLTSGKMASGVSLF